MKHVALLSVEGAEVTLLVKQNLSFTEANQMALRAMIYKWLLEKGYDLSVKIV